jgi:hypothetical protein
MQDLGYTKVEVLTMLDVGKKLLSQEENTRFFELFFLSYNLELPEQRYLTSLKSGT